MIAASRDVVYIEEPFNINKSQLGLYDLSFDNWFTYITHENEKGVYRQIKQIIELRYSLFVALKKNLISPQRLKNEIKNYLKFLCYRLRGKRVLIKDPIAVLSAEWLAKRFDMQMIVLIRHPAAFVASLKKQGWTHNFNHFLRQPRLMQDLLHPYHEKIFEYAKNPPDIIDQACLLWRIIYFVVHKYQRHHTDWYFLRHEDISRNPLEQFHLLFNYLGLTFAPRVQTIIQDYSNSSNQIEYQKNNYTLKRDSKSNIWNWQQRLTSSEISRIRGQVKDVSIHFYSDDEWSR